MEDGEGVLPRHVDKSEGEVPRDPLGAWILTWIFESFWGDLAARTWGDRFPLSKSPSLASGAFIASNLIIVFQKSRKNVICFLSFS